MIMSEALLINPFYIAVEPMQRLLLINFSKDNDDYYIGLEPQVFKSAQNEESYVVIGWRRDGKVDVYFQLHSDVEGKDYNHTGKGLSEKIKTSFTTAQFDVESKGIKVAFSFTDKYGREISIEISEHHLNDTDPFSLLAPMGMASEKPTVFPLIFLYDFYFVRKKGSKLKVMIAGRKHKLDMLPIPLDGRRMTFARYSSKPLIAYLNPALDDYLGVIKLTYFQKEIKSGDSILEFKWTDTVPSIKRLTHLNPVYPIAITFSPPFPNITDLKKNELSEGSFSITSHPSVGTIHGSYTVIRKGNEIKIKCSPALGWQPVEEKWEVNMLYRLAPIFTQWPKTYEWTGYITERNKLNYYMHSKWKRLNSS